MDTKIQVMGLRVLGEPKKNQFALLCHFNVIFRRLCLSGAGLQRVGYFLKQVRNFDTAGYFFFICLHSETDGYFVIHPRTFYYRYLLS